MDRSKKALIASVLGGLAFLAFILLTRASVTASVSPLPPVTLKPLATWTDDLVLKFGEPPSGWRLGGETSYDEQGKPSRFYWFENPQGQQAGATLSEEFVVYTTTAQAQQAYPHLRDKSFPPAYADNWKTMAELAIQDHANEMKTACLPSALFNSDSSTLACGSIARYENLIVFTDSIVLPDQWMTLSDYHQMLVAVDRRVAEVLSQ